MKLTIVLPESVLLETDAVAVTAHGRDGSFGLLERHVDFVTALRPSLLRYVDAHGHEAYAAVDAGVLIKRGTHVVVATRSGVLGTDLGSLRATIMRRFETIDQREKQTRSALASLESSLVRRMSRLGEGVRL
jgi:F-type H+-transporting ATPase subunit epsilon